MNRISALRALPLVAVATRVFAPTRQIRKPIIRSFPVNGASNEPEYHFGCGDGPKLPDQAISYRRRLPAAELSARVQQYIASCGYTPSDSAFFSGVAYVNGNKTLYLNVSTSTDGTTQLHAQVWLGTTANRKQ